MTPRTDESVRAVSSFLLDLGNVSLTLHDLWPDGDGPANPTAQDVADLIEKCGGAIFVARDWRLIDSIEITGNGTAVAR